MIVTGDIYSIYCKNGLLYFRSDYVLLSFHIKFIFICTPRNLIVRRRIQTERSFGVAGLPSHGVASSNIRYIAQHMFHKEKEEMLRLTLQRNGKRRKFALNENCSLMIRKLSISYERDLKYTNTPVRTHNHTLAQTQTNVFKVSVE